MDISELKENLKLKIDEIAYLAENINWNNINTINVTGDKTSIAIFLIYYSKFKQDQRYYDIGYNLIDDVFDLYNTNTSNLLGLAKFGWFLEHLEQNDFLEIDINNIFSELDNTIFNEMINNARDSNFDFLHGALCYGLFYLKRPQNAKIEKHLGSLLFSLKEKSLNEASNEKKWLSVLNKEKNLSGFNISLSHGIASIIIILCKIYVRDVEKKTVTTLLNGAIKYLLNQKLDISKYNSFFPMWAKESMVKLTSSRLAWCYGDLGIAMSLFHASNALSDIGLKNEAINIFLHSSKRKNLENNGVIDAGFCHGTVGIAHIFNRMFINTGIEEFNEAAIYWFDQTLKMAKFKNGLAGYKIWRTEKYGGWQNDYSLLEGIAGIGLAMISSVSDIDPTWDECLLLS